MKIQLLYIYTSRGRVGGAHAMPFPRATPSLSLTSYVGDGS